MAIQTAATDALCQVDQKKYLWPLASLFLTIPALSTTIAVVESKPLLLILSPVLWLIVIPLLDIIFPQNRASLASTHGGLASERYQRSLLRLVIPCAYLTAAWLLWILSHTEFTVPGTIAVGASLGFSFAVMALIAPLLASSEHTIDRILAYVAAILSGGGAARRAHLNRVATPQDSLSARMGEGIYRFAIRACVGLCRDTADDFAQAQGRREKFRRITTNSTIGSGVSILATTGALCWGLGPHAALAGLIAIAIAILARVCATYVQHYGLLRAKNADGGYNNGESIHAWDNYAAVSSFFLFNATRHNASHRQTTALDFQSSGHLATPRLPYNYPWLFIAALIPPLWYRIMNWRLAAWVDGDMQRVNLDAGTYFDLMEKYHRPSA